MKDLFSKKLRLKPPKWEYHKNLDGDESWFWQTVFCTFNIYKDSDTDYRWEWCIDEYYNESSGICESLEDAQAAGVEWYLDLIASAFQEKTNTPSARNPE